VGVTFRSIVLGLILIPFNALWMASTEMVWLTGTPTTLSLFYHVMFNLFWIVLGNELVKKVRPAWALEPGELLVVYSMQSIASALGSIDFIDVLIPMMAYLDHYGPVEGKYQELRPHVPDWLVVKDPAALKSFYLGQESIFDRANLVPWLGPLAWWLGFIVALCAVLWGLNLVFRKQWTEHEKLAYPIIQLPLHLSANPERLLADRLFWAAFVIAALIDVVNGLSFLFPLLPKIPVVHVVNIQQFFPQRPWSDMGALWVSFYPFAIGMCFFMPLDLAFSCWFFFVFWKMQRVLASHIGVHGMPGFPFVEEQTAGGYYAIALIALWISRRQIGRMGKLLLGEGTEAATAWERREARLAAGFIAGGGAFLLYFCARAGMTMSVSVVFFGLYFLLSVGITRMRAELGQPCHDLHFIGPEIQIVKLVGAARMRKANPRDLTMFGLFFFFNRAYRSHPMPHGLEAFRIAERLKLDNFRYLIAMGLAVVFGTVCAFGALLLMLNKYGATQVSGLGEWFGREAWDYTNLWFTTPQPQQNQPTYAILIGLLFALGLSALRMNLTWFPFHPVGYATSGSWAMDQLWMSIFVAWLVKSLLLRYGGARAYRPAVPFFLGLIMGDFIAGAFWNLFGTLAGMPVYHFWPY